MKNYILLMSVICLTNLQAGTVMDVAKEKGCDVFYQETEESGLMKHATAAVGAQASMAPFTVFVPNNTAMNTIAQLPADAVKDIIKIHVVPAQEFKTKETIPTDGIATVAEGCALSCNGDTITVTGGTSAKIIDGPIGADNGTVYIIDAVLQLKK